MTLLYAKNGFFSNDYNADIINILFALFYCPLINESIHCLHHSVCCLFTNNIFGSFK